MSKNHFSGSSARPRNRFTPRLFPLPSHDHDIRGKRGHHPGEQQPGQGCAAFVEAGFLDAADCVEPVDLIAPVVRHHECHRDEILVGFEQAFDRGQQFGQSEFAVSGDGDHIFREVQIAPDLVADIGAEFS